MPTIDQLAPATSASDTDELVVSQDGIARSITRAQLFSGYQPEIALASGTILGRSSPGSGGPEQLSIGSNLALLNGTISATATPYTVSALPAGVVPSGSDIVPLGQGGANTGVSYAQFMSGLSALTNIDASAMLVTPSGGGSSEPLGNLAKNALQKTGDTMTGPLTLAADPVSGLGAATKQYVDSYASAAVPAAGGVMTGPLTLSGNPTIALQAATKAYVDTQAAAALPISGGLLSGPLTLSADPAAPMHAATKQYVDGFGATFESSGAKGDGRTDDTSAINNFLAQFGSGERVLVPAGKFYLIDSGNLVVPTGVIIEGTPSLANESRGALFTGCGFLLNPTYSITLGYAAQLRNLKILRAGLVEGPSSAQVLAAVSTWATEALGLITTQTAAVGTAILEFASTAGLSTGMPVYGKGIMPGTTVLSLTGATVSLSQPIAGVSVANGQGIRFGASIGIVIPNNEGNNVLEDLQIIGFRTGILALAGELFANRVQGDCITILEATWAGDNAYLHNFHCVPYYGVSQGNAGNCWRRPGPAFYLHDQADGWTLSNFFALHWETGYQLSNVGAVTLIRCGYEKIQDGWTGTTGFLFQGHEASCQCFDGYAFGASVNLDMQQTGEVQISGMSTIGCTDGTGVAHYRLGTTSWGAIYNPMMVEVGPATPVIVQANVVRWKIVAPFIDGSGAGPWITIDPSSLSAVDVFMVRDAAGNSVSGTETHLHEKMWITTDPSVSTTDGSPQTTLALEATTGGTAAVAHLELVRAGAPSGSLQSFPPGSPQPGVALVAGGGGSVILAPSGGAIVAGIPDGNASGGITRGSLAIDLQMARSTASQVAAGGQSAIVGGNGNSTTAAWGVAGGNSNQVNGTAGVAFGFGNRIGGAESSAPGGANGNDRGRTGVLVWSSDVTAPSGSRQRSTQILGATTADATPTRLTADSAAPSGVNTVNLPDWSLYALRALVAARHVNASDAAVWTLDGLLLHRASGAASVTLTGGGTLLTPHNAIGASSGWSIDVLADTVTGGLSITARGAAGTSIHWTASVDATEIT